MAEQKQKEVLELQVPTTLKGLIEALVFAAKEPLTVKQLKDIYEGDGPQAFLRHLETEEVDAAIDELNAEYEKAEKPFRIIRIAGGFQFATIPLYAEWIGRLYKEQGRRKLSQSGIESLAIIAYKQPVTKSDIESIRGVNCDYVLKTLLEKELVTVVGRAHAPGRPLLYGTTREFLKHFGLNEITDLPRPREIEEILGESQFETERRMLEAQAGAEKMKDEEPDFKSRLPHIPKKKPELESPVEIKSKSPQLEIRTTQPQETEHTPQPELPLAQGEAELEPVVVPQMPQTVVSVPIEEIPTSDEKIEMPVYTLPPAVSLEAPAVPDTSEPEELVEPEEAVPLSASTETTAEIQVPPTVAEAVPDVTEEIPDVGEEVPDERLKLVPTEERMDERQVLEDSPGLSTALPNKSRWQTWKEKVQGFIRKIFG